jgi:exodeoxyribonuclease V beta subunit
LEAARTFSGRVPRQWTITSYSGILEGSELMAVGPAETGPLEAGHAIEGGESAPGAPDSPLEDRLREILIEPAPAPEIRPRSCSIHSFPHGPGPGTFLHGLLEWAAGEGFSRVAQERALLEEKINVAGSWHGWQDWTGLLTDWLRRLLSAPLPLPLGAGPMPLSLLGPESCRAEMEFLFAARQVSVKDLDRAVRGAIFPGASRPRLNDARVNGMLKGFVDLVFRHAGRYYIMDYKSNHLGEGPEAYTRPALEAAMLDHRYDLQYVLYTLALHRLLKSRLPGYDYERDMGGALYLFLRGVDGTGRGVYGDRPPRELIEALDAAFAGKEGPHGI